MPSSTSLSNSGRPWFALLVLLSATVTLALLATYSQHWNQETLFFVDCAQAKQAWARQIDARSPSKFVIFGGSSCNISIDAGRLATVHHLPTVNMGLGAGMGQSLLWRWALTEVRPRDTLVVALEPGLIADSPEHPALAVQFAYAMQHPEWLDGVAGEAALSPPSAWLRLRPGGTHMVSLAAKWALGQRLYRYDRSQIDPSGWHRVDLRLPLTTTPEAPSRLPSASVALLEHARSWCNSNEVRVAYALPWVYCPSNSASHFRRKNAAFLVSLANHLPILKDPKLGVHEVSADFSDSVWHLHPTAAARRTDALAPLLRDWILWSSTDLIPLATQTPEISAP